MEDVSLEFGLGQREDLQLSFIRDQVQNMSRIKKRFGAPSSW